MTSYSVGDRVEYNPEKGTSWLRYDGTKGIVIGIDEEHQKVLVKWDETSALYDAAIIIRQPEGTPMLPTWVRLAHPDFSVIPEPQDSDLE